MATAPRVALFGLLGSGNLGNHGSLDAMLRYLRAEHPHAQLACVCAGPEEMERQYGIASLPINWYHLHDTDRSRATSVPLKVFGKAADAVRTFRWVRRFDVVIVPGMGVLEATLPIRPWGFPYALFLVSLWGRLSGTKVALVSVGANAIRQPVTRWFVKYAGKLACYRSYRDVPSRDAMRLMGVDTSRDHVYPDLAFALPDSPPDSPTDSPTDSSLATGRARTVGVGVMAYYGTYLDRRQADEIHTRYVEKLVTFVRWLVDNGHRVRLFTGDPADEPVASAVVSDIRRTRPDLAGTGIVSESASSLGELMRQMSTVDTVVASRYHNVLSALKLAKPTISISYASKNDVLMDDMGLGEFCQPIRSLDVPRLIEQFQALDARRESLQQVMLEGNERNKKLLDEQNAVLSATLFAADGPARIPAAAGSD